MYELFTDRVRKVMQLANHDVKYRDISNFPGYKVGRVDLESDYEEAWN